MVAQIYIFFRDFRLLSLDKCQKHAQKHIFLLPMFVNSHKLPYLCARKTKKLVRLIKD